MKNQTKRLLRKFFFTASLLSLWSILCGYLVFRFDLDYPVLAIILNILIILLSLWLPFPIISWVSFLFSAIQYSIVIFLAQGFTNQAIISSAICTALFLASKLFSTIHKNQISVLMQQLHETENLIEALTIYDRNTNLIKWRITKNTLVREIVRSQHYKRQLSIILFEVQRKGKLSRQVADKIYKNITEVIQDVIRTDIDIPFIGEHIGLILPDRDLVFTQEFAKLIILMVGQNLNTPISAGIANFPQNANSAQELVDSATSALRVALKLNEPFVTYHSHLADTGDGKLREKPDSSLEFTQVEVPEVKRNLFHDYETILTNLNLEEHEWIIWLHGFNRIEDLYNSENNLQKVEHISNIEFLFVQANHLVVKIKSTLDDLNEREGAFPGWEIKKINLRTQYILLHQSE